MYKSSRFLKFFLVAVLLTVSVSSTDDYIVSAQGLSAAERAALESQLKDEEKELLRLEQELTAASGQKKTLQGELDIIKNKIAQSKAKISQTNTQLKKISLDINQKEKKIETLASRINQNKTYISKTLSEMRKLDDVRAVIAFSKDENFSEVFKDLGDYRSIQEKLNENVLSLKTNKKIVQVEKEVLQDKKEQTEALKFKQEQDRKEEEARGREKDDLVKLAKQQEKDFQKVLDEKKKKVAEIKAKLFSFAGGQTAAIPFATALQYAQLAETRTGTPAAFVLAILTQESALGANVGRCYLTDSATGAGINVKTNATYKNVMKPTRDVQPFISITSALGFDWRKTVVSCPIAGVAGWGGAMGPAQFIASTWQTVGSRVAAITGSSNPWSAQDSIVASATYLSDLGASSSYLSQIKAACKYYGTGGSNCKYGREVMAKLTKIQADIDYIKQYGTAKN